MQCIYEIDHLILVDFCLYNSCAITVSLHTFLSLVITIPASTTSQERARLLKTAKEQEEENISLQENLSKARTELKTAGIRNGELKRTLDEITLQLKRRVRCQSY